VERTGHALSFDPVRQRTLLFGGQLFSVSQSYMGDTWVWDGTNWTEFLPTQAPGPRSYHAMAFDPQRQRVVLFGGSGPSYAILGDTWEWDGSAWIRFATPVAPSARTGHSIAFDAVRQRVLLFGGAVPASPAPLFLSDSWEWDGATWAQLAPAASPAARANHAMATDDLQQRVIMYGGNDWNGTFYDAWEWNGANWTLLPQSGAQPQVNVPAATFDSARHQVLLHGPRQDRETWILGAHVPATVQAVGFGCGGSQGPPVLTSSEPYLGHPAFRLELLHAPPNAACLFGLATSGASQSLGGGCVLRLGSPALPWFAITNAAGFAESPRFAILHDPALWGLTLHAQAGVLDAQAPLGFALSAGRTLVVGD
jgi:hypothetical protein